MSLESWDRGPPSGFFYADGEIERERWRREQHSTPPSRSFTDVFNQVSDTSLKVKLSEIENLGNSFGMAEMIGGALA